MANYEFMYRANVPIQARNDGSGYCDLDLSAVSRLAGTQDTFTEVPSKHKTVSMPAARIQAALATGTNPQKVVAIKNVIAEFLFSGAPVPVPDAWDIASLEAFMDANDVAIVAQNTFNAFVLVVKPSGFPVTFAL